MDWTLDAKHGYIYTFGSLAATQQKVFRKFKLPALSDSDAKGEVHLHKQDVLETFTVDNFPISQGSRIYKGFAYLPEGYNPHDRKLHVLDMKTKKIVRTLNLNPLAKEPEGLDVKGNWLYVSFHQTRTPRGTSFVRFRL